MSRDVALLKEELRDQPGNPLRPAQVQTYEEERERLQTMATAPGWVGANRGAARVRAQEIGRVIEQQAPRPLSGDRESRVKHLLDTVRDEVLVPAMLPQSTMHRYPPGAMGRALRGEFSPGFKDAALTWKRGMQALGVKDGANRDPDWSNLERFRPAGEGPGAATFMAEAQLPGNFAMTPAAKANWPLGEPTTSAVAQVRKRELSEAQKAAMAKGRAARTERLAQRRGAKGIPAQGAAVVAASSPGEE